MPHNKYNSSETGGRRQLLGLPLAAARALMGQLNVTSEGSTGGHIVDRLRYRHDERELAIGLGSVILAEELLQADPAAHDAASLARLNGMVHTNLRSVAALTAAGLRGPSQTDTSYSSLHEPAAEPLLHRSLQTLARHYPEGIGLEQLALDSEHLDTLQRFLATPPEA